MADTFKFVQTQPYTLAGAGAIAGATTLILKSFQDIEGVNLVMTDFGSIGYGTIEPGNGSQEEQISFTGVTQNANGTATLTGVKTVLFKAPYTETSGLAKTHAGSTTFIISNTAGFYNSITGKNNDETITGTWTFTSPNYPRIDSAINPPVDDEQFATKKYADDLAIAGSPVSSTSVIGIVKVSYAPLASTNPIAVADTDPRVPTQGENDALAGTAGTPSSTNKYVTNDDTNGSGLVIRTSLLEQLARSIFGDGNDGDVTISSGTTTLSRDMYYNNLTIQTGGILNPNGYRVFVKENTTFQGTGKIARTGENGANGGNGTAGSSGTPGTGGAGGLGGTALLAGSISGALGGGNGAVGGAGTQGNGGAGGDGVQATTPANITIAIGSTAVLSGGAGGAGGTAYNGVAGGGAGAAPTGGSTVTNPVIMPHTINNLTSLHYYNDSTLSYMKGSAPSVGGSSGGGGGGGNQGTTTSGGGGGGGGGAGGCGGVVLVASHTITGGYEDCIQAKGGTGGNGGNGGNGSATYGGGGGTGGGGNGGTGGVVCLAYNTYSGTILSTTCVIGGTAGTAGVTVGTGGTQGGNGSLGTSGVTGATGKLYLIQV